MAVERHLALMTHDPQFTYYLRFTHYQQFTHHLQFTHYLPPAIHPPPAVPMPTVSRWFIKSGILFMVASMVVALAMAAPDAWGLPGWVSVLRPTHFHLFAVGWITQMIFGVALWFFPKKSREAPRGSAWVNWSCFGTLNAGLVLRAVAETAFVQGYTGTGWSWVMTVAAVLQFAAAVLFAFAIWPRVKGRRKRKKKEK